MNRHIIVFGYGNMGRALALNLRDSEHDISVFLRNNSPRKQAVKDAGIPIITDPSVACKQADIAIFTLPDHAQPEFYAKYMHENLPTNSLLIFAHGLNLHYQYITPRDDLNVALMAPLAHADTVRNDFIHGKGAPCIIAIGQDSSGDTKQQTHLLAQSISKSGPFIDTTIAEEVETDLFTEQALLCGGLPELIRSTFDTLVSSGYSPDIAYFTCIKELRPVVNVIDEKSISGFRKTISTQARYGAATRGPRIIDQGTRIELNKILDEIKSGQFIGEFNTQANQKASTPTKSIADNDHPIEKIHRRYSSKK